VLDVGRGPGRRGPAAPICPQNCPHMVGSGEARVIMGGKATAPTFSRVCHTDKEEGGLI